MDSNQSLQKIRAYLERVVAPKYRIYVGSEKSEIYYDLRLSGTDFYEFLVWLEQEFNVLFAMKLQEYTPSEGWDPHLFRKWRLRNQPYKSFTVADILLAIQAGRWPIED